jgi:hypothetical protein
MDIKWGKFHTMCDNAVHNVPVLGGMFGIKKGAFAANVSMSGLVRSAFREHPDGIIGPGEDQAFLSKYVWPLVSSQAVQHDSLTGRCKEYGAHDCLRFPADEERDGHRFFVGQPFPPDYDSRALHMSEYNNCTFTCLI